MAKIKIHCPECSQKIGVDESAAGTTGDCPTCGSSLLIPEDPAQPVTILVRRPLPPGALISDEENEETTRLKKELAIAHEDLARLRTQLEQSAHEFERFRITLDGMAELRVHLAAEREKSAALAKERDATASQLAEAGDLKLAGEALTHEITRLQQQLTSAARERSALQKSARESDERARSAHLELDQLSNKGDPKGNSLREAVERMTGWERERAVPRPAILPDPATLEALSVARADLASSHAELAKAKARLAELESALSVVTREREEIRADLANRKAAVPDPAAAGGAPADLPAARAELVDTSAALSSAKSTIADLESSLSALTRERDQARAELAARSAAVSEPTATPALAASEEQFTAARAQLAESNARLGELEASVSALTRERDEGRAELARREADLREAAAALRTLRAESDQSKANAAEAIGRRDLALGSKQSEIELLRRTIAEMKGGGVAEPKGETQITERLRQIERQLSEGQDSMRATKNERFKLRERLAKVDADPQSADAAIAEELRRQLNELLARDEAMKKYGQVLLAEQENLKRRLPPKFVEPIKPSPERTAPAPAPAPSKAPLPPPEPSTGAPAEPGVAEEKSN